MSKKAVKLQNQFVYPGEKLAIIEEFQNGDGAYQLEGIVRSTELGQARFNL
ncbi:MAG: RNA-binding protein, partial [Candidatus Bathyarchaeia archaeon]